MKRGKCSSFVGVDGFVSGAGGSGGGGGGGSGIHKSVLKHVVAPKL
jgi:hypothetical protein